MARDTSRRDEVAEAATDYVLEHGLVGLSLRPWPPSWAPATGCCSTTSPARTTWSRRAAGLQRPLRRGDPGVAAVAGRAYRGARPLGRGDLAPAGPLPADVRRGRRARAVRARALRARGGGGQRGLDPAVVDHLVASGTPRERAAVRSPGRTPPLWASSSTCRSTRRPGAGAGGARPRRRGRGDRLPGLDRRAPVRAPAPGPAARRRTPPRRRPGPGAGPPCAPRVHVGRELFARGERRVQPHVGRARAVEQGGDDVEDLVDVRPQQRGQLPGTGRPRRRPVGG